MSRRLPLGDVDVHELDIRRPLDPLPSIKLKLGFLIAAGVGATVFVFWVFLHLGVWPSVSGILAAAVAMGLVWFLSRGLTSPLREMAAAADAMARGDYSRRVTATSRPSRASNSRISFVGRGVVATRQRGL